MQQNFIANQSVASHTGRTLPVIDPSDGQPFDDIQRSDERDINDAVRAARQCFEGPWSALSAAERGRLLMALSRKVAEHADELAAIEQRDCGKPTSQAAADAAALARLEELPGWANTVIGDLLSEVTRLDERITEYDRHIALMARHSTQAQQLMQLGGIGQTTAMALISTVGNGHDFACGRSFSAWLGLVPGQYSSGGKQRLGRITKAGDAYLRSLLVMGARAVLAAAMNTRTPKQDPISRWARSLAERRGYWRAVVAIAAKNARMCWAVLQRGDAFKMPA